MVLQKLPQKSRIRTLHDQPDGLRRLCRRPRVPDLALVRWRFVDRPFDRKGIGGSATFLSPIERQLAQLLPRQSLVRPSPVSHHPTWFSAETHVLGRIVCDRHWHRQCSHPGDGRRHRLPRRGEGGVVVQCRDDILAARHQLVTAVIEEYRIVQKRAPIGPRVFCQLRPALVDKRGRRKHSGGHLSHRRAASTALTARWEINIRHRTFAS